HLLIIYFVFFFQAEDGIRDKLVTGVQTCALPISTPLHRARAGRRAARAADGRAVLGARPDRDGAHRGASAGDQGSADGGHRDPRSEEHTSELQSLAYLVCRLLLEKKKKDLEIAST